MYYYSYNNSNIGLTYGFVPEGLDEFCVSGA